MSKIEVERIVEPDSNPVQAWDDAASEMMLDRHETPEPPGSFDLWFEAEEMSRLSDAIDLMRHVTKCSCGLMGLSGGFCNMGVLSINADGLVLGCQCGVSDDGSRSVTWSTRFVPKSIVMNKTMSSDQLASSIKDIVGEITADLDISYKPDEDEDDFDEPDFGAEEEYMGERCKAFALNEEAT